MDIISFSFAHSGPSAAECFLYSVVREGGAVRLYTEGLYSGGKTVEASVDGEVLKRLGGIARRCGMDRWNGFNKVDKTVPNGSGFSLFITLPGGKSLTARGTNRFPEGYEYAEREICAVFDELIARYGG